MHKLFVVVFVTTALTVSGCGGDSKSSDTQSAAPADTATSTTGKKGQIGVPADSSEAAQKKAVKESASSFMRATIGDDPAVLCEVISAETMKAALAKSTTADNKRPKSCKEFIKEQTASLPKQSAAERQQAIDRVNDSLKDATIKIDGDKAVMTTGSGQTQTKTYLVKEDGRWKLSMP
jgi:hypothetical protein